MHQLALKHAEKIRFLIVGSALAVLDFGLLFTFVHFGVNEIVANYLSTGISFLVSFIINRNYTFRGHSGNRVRQFVLFIVVTMIALWVLQPLVIYLIMKTPLLVHLHQSLALFVAKVLATIVSMTWNYVLYATVVFRKTKG